MAISSDMAQVFVAFQKALGGLSVRSVKTIIRVMTRSAPKSAAQFGQIVAPHAGKSRMEGYRLGLAFYRLYAALAVGSTIAETAKPVTIGQLRKEFETASGVRLRLQTPDTRPIKVKRAGVGLTDSSSKVFAKVVTNAFERWADKIPEESTGAEIRDVAKTMGERVTVSKRDAHIAGGFQKTVLDAARNTVVEAANRHGYTKSFVRMTTGANPCVFCRVLSGRGPVYASEHTALRKDLNNDLMGMNGGYHLHCKCVAVPLFSKRDYYESDMFAANRQAYNDYKDVGSTDWYDIRRAMEGRADGKTHKRTKRGGKRKRRYRGLTVEE